MNPHARILIGDALETLRGLPEASVDCCVTSPPYFGLRDYGVAGQMGLEPTPEAFVEALVQVMREVRRVMKPTGTLWLNLGDSYAGARQEEGHTHSRRRDGAVIPRSDRCVNGLKPKDLIGIPWMVAFALRADGWYLRRDIIWHKLNPMPESIKDRPTTAHEYVFLLSKGPRYYYDAAAIAEPLAESTLREIREGYQGQGTKDYEGAGVQNPSAVKARIIANKRKGREVRPCDSRGGNQGNLIGIPPCAGLTRNKRSVWTIPTRPFKGAHFATFPEALVEPCILAGCPEGGLVLDPFAGSGTVGVVALKTFRRFVGIELNPAYAAMAERRIAAATPGPPLFTESA